MKKTILPLILFIAASALAQQTPPPAESTGNEVATTNGLVTIASKGSDVRSVLYDLFTQSNKNFVLEPNLYFVLYLSLAGVEFEEALNIVCNVANLEYQVDNGITFISKKKAPVLTPTTTKAASLVTPTPKPAVKRGKLTTAELDKRLTTRFSRTPIEEVFKSIAEQTKIEIVLDKDVPAYKLDAFLIDTSLQYALDVLCRSTGLKYSLTDDKQVRISKS